MKKPSSFLCLVLFALISSVATAQPLRYGDEIHLQNKYRDWSGGFLDIRNAGCEGNLYCVSTAASRNRDRGGGTWRIVSAGGKPAGAKVSYGDEIHLQNKYRNWSGGFLDIRNAGCEDNLYCASTATSKDRDPHGNAEGKEAATGVWRIVAANGVPTARYNEVFFGDEIHLQNKYRDWSGGFLDIRKAGCEGNLYCVSTAASKDRDPPGNAEGKEAATGVWRVPRYQDQGDGTVLDLNTGLIWLKDASCLKLATWRDAHSKIAALNDGTDYGCTDYAAGTHSDWRMASLSEFCSASTGTPLHCSSEAAWDSLVDYSANPPKVSMGNLFAGLKWQHHSGYGDRYWTGTERESYDASRAWTVSLLNGSLGDDNKVDLHYVWPVRSAFAE